MLHCLLYLLTKHIFDKNVNYYKMSAVLDQNTEYRFESVRGVKKWDGMYFYVD